jgi:hypothetical protein
MQLVTGLLPSERIDSALRPSGLKSGFRDIEFPAKPSEKLKKSLPKFSASIKPQGNHTPGQPHTTWKKC